MDITITVTNQQATRVATAVGQRFNLKDTNGVLRQASIAEVQTFIIQLLRQTVREQERQTAIDAVTTAEF